MSNTIKYWLVANLEVLLACALILFVVLGYLWTDILGLNTEENNGKLGIVFFGPLLVCAAINHPAGASGDFVKLIIWLGVFVLFIFFPEDGISIKFQIAATLSLLISGFIAIMIAGFAYRNIGEIVSRRMLYRNSRVSLFDITWKYTLNRFTIVFLYLLTICIFLMICISVRTS